ncbi:hypothetical protein V8C26DRAFT_395600 [Trichoderma gracile]
MRHCRRPFPFFFFLTFPSLSPSARAQSSTFVRESVVMSTAAFIPDESATLRFTNVVPSSPFQPEGEKKHPLVRQSSRLVGSAASRTLTSAHVNEAEDAAQSKEEENPSV